MLLLLPIRGKQGAKMVIALRSDEFLIKPIL